MFLVRSAFWLSVVILLLPAEKAKDNAELSKVHANVTAGQAFIAAQSTVDDLSGFCLRNQVACETGKTAMDTFIRKAQYGADLLNEWVSGISSANAATVKPVKLSSLRGLAKEPRAGTSRAHFIHLAGNSRSSQHTLTKEDLKPSWGGPMIKRKA